MTSALAGPAGSALTSAKQNAPPVAGRSQEPARVTYLQSLGRGVAVLDLISQSVPGISAHEIACRAAWARRRPPVPDRFGSSQEAPRPVREDRSYRCPWPGRRDTSGASAETGSGRRPPEVMMP